MDEIGVGHNRPPSLIDDIKQTAQDMSAWMAETPVIQTEDQAREAKLFIDRGHLGLKDLNDERRGRVDPLNEQVKQINSLYRGPSELLERVTDELKQRVTSFLLKQETERIRLREEAEKRVREAEAIARLAEQRERDVYADANSGVLGVNIADATANADAAYAAYEKADREAAIAERETHVKIGGGFRRAASLRSREVLIVDDPLEAIRSIGLDNGIVIEAILKAARAYKKVTNKYPNGIRVEIEREV